MTRHKDLQPHFQTSGSRGVIGIRSWVDIQSRGSQQARTLLHEIYVCESRQQEMLGDSPNARPAVRSHREAQRRASHGQGIQKAIRVTHIHGGQLAISAQNTVVW